MTKEKFLYGLNACAVTYHNGQKFYEHDELVECFDDLGLFKQEPKTGRWVKISPADIYECSTCGLNMITPKIKAYKFCPTCGAKMEGGQNGK